MRTRIFCPKPLLGRPLLRSFTKSPLRGNFY
nr:MAG TPA: hypothetical protein [Caudoviricetes sp.]